MDELKIINDLINNNTIHVAAPLTRREGVHFEITLAIGNDHTASLTLTDDALIALGELLDE